VYNTYFGLCHDRFGAL